MLINYPCHVFFRVTNTFPYFADKKQSKHHMFYNLKESTNSSSDGNLGECTSKMG